MVIECFAILFSALLSRFRFKFSEKAGCLPILLVHGYLHRSTAWIYLKQRLEKEGLGPIFTIDLASPFHSIKTHAEKVAKMVEYLRKEKGIKKLALVGHSMGGLVCGWYATHLALPDQVAALITLGSPLYGTFASYLALGVNGREMRPGSWLLKELREKIEASPVCFYHLASRTDQLIIPYTSALLGHRRERQKLLSNVGHMGLLYSPRVARQIIFWLSEKKARV